MRFQKNIAFLFGALALISYCSYAFLPKTEEIQPVSVVQSQKMMDVYLRKAGLLVPMQMARSGNDIESFVEQYLGYLCGKGKLKNASGYDYPKLELKQVTQKEDTLKLDFNSVFLEIKATEELGFLQSLIQMVRQLEGIRKWEVCVNGIKLSQMRYGTRIPETLEDAVGVNSFVNEGTLLHHSKPLIVYRILKDQGKNYYVPIELRISDNLSVEDQLNLIIQDHSYHPALSMIHHEQLKTAVKDNQIQVSGQTSDEIKPLRNSLLELIHLSLNANGLQDVVVMDQGKVSKWEKEHINLAEF